jgi:hypothetical protein
MAPRRNPGPRLALGAIVVRWPWGEAGGGVKFKLSAAEKKVKNLLDVF